ncbi:MAG TPA: glycoside hydrolase family 2 [Firmicutes bacterium]|jgi:beta-galactosidase/beta-glucuronidase|nr:glycoside hydrolase family 2 [Bacillota bacterium]
MKTLEWTLNEYPRPQFVRRSWDNLNGLWDFAFDDQNIGEAKCWYHHGEFDKKINVPFVYESKASGIQDETHHPNVWYQRAVVIDSQYAGQRILLHFQGADYLTKVWVNGAYLGLHRGSSNKFQFDITHFVKLGAANSITVKCEDSKSCCQPRGKQRWHDKNFGCWYVQSTGIWKTVWIEYVADTHIEKVKITPDVDDASVLFEYSIHNFEVHPHLKIVTTLSYKGQLIREVTLKPDRSFTKLKVDITNDTLVEGVHFKFPVWDIGQPNLYDVNFKLFSGETLLDEVTSYFGMRKISIKNGKIFLNNAEIYQKLLLDQGYWPDSLLTPPGEAAILEDIDKTLAMGFNGVRKHMKVEDERFLYWCDHKGLLVWSEFPACYEYNDQAVENFVPEWLEVVEQNYNHPAIVTWVPLNESWGIPNIGVNKQQQSFAQSLYYLTKALDKSRPVIVNDGWEHTISDILSIHDYEELGDVFTKRYQEKERVIKDEVLKGSSRYNFAENHSYQGQPIIISEYGGIAFKSESGWGYGNQVGSEEEFLSRYQAITEAIKKCDYICGYCYTQITDVQQEINGLLTEDRVPKIGLEKIKKINDIRHT